MTGGSIKHELAPAPWPGGRIEARSACNLRVVLWIVATILGLLLGLASAKLSAVMADTPLSGPARFAVADPELSRVTPPPRLPVLPNALARPQFFVLAIAGLIMMISLIQSSLAVALRAGVRRARPRRRDEPHRPDTRQSCQLLFQQLQAAYREADTAVMALLPGSPLQSLLLGELNQIARKLQAIPEHFQPTSTAIAVGEHPQYWRTLARRLRAAVKDLRRIREVAAAGVVTFGHEQRGPDIPKSLEEAYLVIGANGEVDDDILKRLVRALRQCWHPDLAQNDQDRAYREARIRQINVAADMISASRVMQSPMKSVVS